MGRIFVITGPSTAGEDSVIDGLKKLFPVYVPTTTSSRQIRPFESEGHPYYFISKKKFLKGIDNNDYFEWALQDRGNYYGVTHEEIKKAIDSGKVILWKIDYKGALAAKKLLPEAKVIFLFVPPEIIEMRLKARDNATADYIQDRVNYAQGWYDNRHNFDFEIYNEEGKLAETVKKAAEIIKKEILTD
jgi:guanylate kinase